MNFSPAASQPQLCLLQECTVGTSKFAQLFIQIQGHWHKATACHPPARVRNIVRVQSSQGINVESHSHGAASSTASPSFPEWVMSPPPLSPPQAHLFSLLSWDPHSAGISGPEAHLKVHLALGLYAWSLGGILFLPCRY
jgi:hypothetical protein